jgi:LacI family transcriptional regulator
VAYFRSTGAVWDLFVVEDLHLRLSSIEQWQADGTIADFDDPAVAVAVAVDGSYACEDGYPPGIPYVASINFKLVELAYDDRVATWPPARARPRRT